MKTRQAGRIERWTDRQVEKQTQRQTNRHAANWTDIKTGGQTDER
jgi:hypothetical protein